MKPQSRSTPEGQQITGIRRRKRNKVRLICGIAMGIAIAGIVAVIILPLVAPVIKKARILRNLHEEKAYVYQLETDDSKKWRSRGFEYYADISRPIYGIRMTGRWIDDAWMRMIQEAPGITDTLVFLHFHNCDITSEAIHELRTFTRLNDLKFVRSTVNDDGWQELATGAVGLRTLDVEGTSLSRGACLAISKIHSLESLNASNTAITDKIAVPLCELENLVMLDLRYTNVGPHFVRSLSQLRKLIILTLTGTPLSGVDLSHLSRLPDLEMLDLMETAVDDTSFKQLEGAPKLTNLSLGDTRVTGRYLERLKYLQVVDLAGTAVNRRTFTILAGMKTLKRIDVSRTSVTKSDVDLVRKEHSSLEVLHESDP